MQRIGELVQRRGLFGLLDPRLGHVSLHVDRTPAEYEGIVENFNSKLPESPLLPESLRLRRGSRRSSRRRRCPSSIGNGGTEEGGCHNVHSPLYDFNDAILTTGAAYWVNLLQLELGEAG